MAQPVGTRIMDVVLFESGIGIETHDGKGMAVLYDYPASISFASEAYRRIIEVMKKRRGNEAQ